MKISCNLLNQLIDLVNINTIHLTEKLTLSGFEVENVTYIKEHKDNILDINITTNREDITSYLHIAIEISALFQRQLKLDYPDNQLITLKKYQNISQKTFFQQVYICFIKNIFIKHNYEKILQDILSPNTTSTTNILDVINFINLKWGQNIQIYTSKKTLIDTTPYNSFSIKFNKKNKKTDIYLNNKILIKIDANNICDYKNSSDFLLINHINQNTSTRYLINYSIYAYKETLEILKTTNLTKKKTHTVYEYKNTINDQYNLVCKTSNINNILGPDQQNRLIDKQIVINILKYLNFRIETISEYIYITVPNERKKDIKYQIDIIEEVGRIYGFSKFYDKLPKFIKKNSISKITNFNQKIRRILRNMGLYETINPSLQDNTINPYLQILNPLNQEQSILRSNLIHGLVLAKLNNNKYNHKEFETFEIGKIFTTPSSSCPYTESLHLCCLLGHNNFNKSTWQEESSPLTWFQAKGQIEDLLDKLNAKTEWSTMVNNNKIDSKFTTYIHPQNKIYLKNDKTTIGIFSQLKNPNSKPLSILNQTYFFEVDIYELSKTINSSNHLQYGYVQYSHYPTIIRDISITLNLEISLAIIQSHIKNMQNYMKNVIESISVVNEYYNVHQAKTTRTICMRITYRSYDKTLKNVDINKIDNIIKKQLMYAIKSKT